MKQNIMKNQYIQLSKEKFIEIMKKVPFVSDIEIMDTNSAQVFGDFRAIVHYSDKQEAQYFSVTVRSNGEKRYVNDFIGQVSQFQDDDCYVFMAPYISEVSAESIYENHLSYIDLSGNCNILSKRIFIHFHGEKNKYIERKEKKNYFVKSSGAASAIIRTMLSDFKRSWQVIELSKEANKAIGTVSNVKAFLRDRDWIEDTSHREFKLKNIKEMLYSWAEDYHKKDSRTFEYYSFDSIAELEQKISNWSREHQNSALLGGFSAAARYAPTVRYNKIEVYVEYQMLQKFLSDFEMQHVNNGGNVIITIPHDETPCMFHREINGSIITSPVQTVLDLLGKAGRGEEAAEAIIAKEFREGVY